jgi:hypothetical protein
MEMPSPFFTTLISIPWKELLKQAPSIAAAADALLSGTKTHKETRLTASAVTSLMERVEALETHDRADAQLVKRLADQVEVLTFSTKILASRLKAALVIAVIGIIIGCSALIYFIIMGR